MLKIKDDMTIYLVYILMAKRMNSFCVFPHMNVMLTGASHLTATVMLGSSTKL